MREFLDIAIQDVRVGTCCVCAGGEDLCAYLAGWVVRCRSPLTAGLSFCISLFAIGRELLDSWWCEV